MASGRRWRWVARVWRSITTAMYWRRTRVSTASPPGSCTAHRCWRSCATRAAENAAREQLDRLGMVEVGLYAYEQGLRRLPLDENDFVLQPDERKPPLAADGWKPALDTLAAAGFRLTFDAGFPRDELVDVDDWHAEVQASGNPWFDLRLGIDVAGERIDLLPVLRRLLCRPGFPLVRQGRARTRCWLRADGRRGAARAAAAGALRALMAPLLEWLATRDGELRVALATRAGHVLDALDRTPAVARRRALRAELDRLRDRASRPANRKASARRCAPTSATAWPGSVSCRRRPRRHPRRRHGPGQDRAGARPHAGREAARPARPPGAGRRADQPDRQLAGRSRAASRPDLRVLVLHGHGRATDCSTRSPTHDLVLTTYRAAAARRRRAARARLPPASILDEAQYDQERRAARRRSALRALDAAPPPVPDRHAAGEPPRRVVGAVRLRSMPGLLGDEKPFTRHFRTPIEKHGDDPSAATLLSRRIAPFMLRRTQGRRARRTAAEDRDRAPRRARRRAARTVRNACAWPHGRERARRDRQRGLAQSQIVILDALLKLRQVCCDPRLVKLGRREKATRIGQARRPAATCSTTCSTKAGAMLVFSQFTEHAGADRGGARRARASPTQC